ncbi:hypothetical protein GA0070624_5852 [Micromonospora rhizosphaerae]|uniref:Uncharacterized protein n=1 Tax=Micromonospora rhizosphaerae TaxID=568872 RepID=A0A1C6T6F0_9ACTN|nr:hypothetical protein GA0070624_5852 [Micromonospora rhizosphaerae]
MPFVERATRSADRLIDSVSGKWGCPSGPDTAMSRMLSGSSADRAPGAGAGASAAGLALGRAARGRDGADDVLLHGGGVVVLV